MVKRVLSSILALTLVLTFNTEQSKAKESLILATATTGGTYYPVGVAIGTLSSIKLAKKQKAKVIFAQPQFDRNTAEKMCSRPATSTTNPKL